VNTSKSNRIPLLDIVSVGNGIEEEKQTEKYAIQKNCPLIGTFAARLAKIPISVQSGG
jgi:hypothetical protein